jgi:hypothetical protein
MSVVTNVVVSYDELEHDNPSNLAELRAWFEPIGGIRAIAGGDRGWSRPPSWWGGTKNPECELWGGAYNGLDHAAFWNHMNRLRWAYPDSVQVFIKEQEDVRFQVWMISNGAFAQIIDGGKPD